MLIISSLNLANDWKHSMFIQYVKLSMMLYLNVYYLYLQLPKYCSPYVQKPVLYILTTPQHRYVVHGQYMVCLTLVGGRAMMAEGARTQVKLVLRWGVWGGGLRELAVRAVVILQMQVQRCQNANARFIKFLFRLHFLFTPGIQSQQSSGL